MSREPDIAISAEDLGKAYRIWRNPSARLKYPLQRFATELLPGPLRRLVERRRSSPGREPAFVDFHALRGLSFSVARGEAVGIIGRNGSGKSTLLQLIAGTLAPSSGGVRTRGRVAALLELGSGFNPEFTGRENVYLYAGVLGLTKAEVDAVFDEIAAFADIGAFIDQPIKTYSSGMSLRLAFAVIVHIKADILIIDEALAVGDAFFVQKCMRWIRRFRETGTLLFVTHNTAEVMALCDRAIWLKDGSPERIGPAKDVCEAYLAYYHSAETGGVVVEATGPAKPSVEEAAKFYQGAQVLGNDVVDQRQAWLNATQFRNDIKPLVFDPDQAWFGTGAARITGVEFVDAASGKPLSHIVGGELVVLRLQAEAHAEIINPIFGFYIKDRLGQYLFGDNTYLSNIGRELRMRPGERFTAEFTFRMPLLPQGSYAIAPGFASGSQLDHAQQCWMHEALILESTNPVTHRGLVAIPMLRIESSVRPAARIS